MLSCPTFRWCFQPPHFFLGLWNWTNLTVLHYFLCFILSSKCRSRGQPFARVYIFFSFNVTGIDLALVRRLEGAGISKYRGAYFNETAKVMQMQYDPQRKMHETRIKDVTGGGWGKTSGRLVCILCCPKAMANFQAYKVSCETWHDDVKKDHLSFILLQNPSCQELILRIFVLCSAAFLTKLSQLN